MGETDLSFEQILELLKAKMSQPYGAYPTPYNVAASQMPQQQQGILGNMSRPQSFQVPIPNLMGGAAVGAQLSPEAMKRLMDTELMKNLRNLPNRISNSMWPNYAGRAAAMNQPMNIGFPSMVSGAMGMPR